MKKKILNLGKALSKAEQKQIFGGTISIEVEGCSQTDGLYCDCPSGSYGNAEGCGCNNNNDCVMGKCWKGINGKGMFGMCHA